MGSNRRFRYRSSLALATLLSATVGSLQGADSNLYPTYTNMNTPDPNQLWGNRAERRSQRRTSNKRGQWWNQK